MLISCIIQSNIWTGFGIIHRKLNLADDKIFTIHTELKETSFLHWIFDGGSNFNF